MQPILILLPKNCVREVSATWQAEAMLQRRTPSGLASPLLSKLMLRTEYITAYKKVHPVEILKGYAIDAMAPGYENYSDFSEWAFDDVKEKEYIERAFFADTEEEARQIILDYQEYLKTNNGGEMEKFLDYMTEQSKTRDDFAY